MKKVCTNYFDESNKLIIVPFGEKFKKSPHSKIEYYKCDDGLIHKVVSFKDENTKGTVFLMPSTAELLSAFNHTKLEPKFKGKLFNMNKLAEEIPVFEKDETEMGVDDSRLSINELFISISGEVGIIPQGTLVTVLRLQKCNLSCDYCDAKGSQGSGVVGQIKQVEELVNIINENGLPLLITGGEPLLQSKGIGTLLNCIDNSIVVQIETNGTINPLKINKELLNRLDDIHFVMDYKLHSPPTVERLKMLTSRDYLKFVVTDSTELMEAFFIIGKLNNPIYKIAISSTKSFLYRRMIKVIKKTNIQVLVNVQIHKFIDVQ